MIESLELFIFVVVLILRIQIGIPTSMLITILIASAVILVLTAIVFLSDSLIQIEAQKSGIDIEKENYGIFPDFKSLLGTQAPANIDADKYHVLKKGHNIKLTGEASPIVHESQVQRFAVRPSNFRGNAPIPKLLVAEGDEVKAGDPLFYDKTREGIKYVAPVSGEVVEIRRGQKRAITDVVILADKEQKYRVLDAPSVSESSREDIQSFLQQNGGWNLINQRPFDIVPDVDVVPRDIFISTFSTAPLAADRSLLVEGKGAAFQKGLNVLNKLTDGKVFLSLKSTEDNPVFTQAMGVEKHYFSGPHPAGNVGVQIHHIKPINANEPVWTLGVQEVITLGKLFTEKKFDGSRVIAIAGGPLAEAKYVKTYMGANIADLLNGQDVRENNRIVCGDVLSGKKTSMDSFLNYSDTQITVLKEGNDHELFGWLLPIKPRPSVSKTYPGFLMPNYSYEANTNTHGEKRAFVVTGGYEKLLPMDIHVQHLMKAILANDIEKMEGLGITELSEEDIALAEFSDISKQPMQSILRQGLDLIREQG